LNDPLRQDRARVEYAIEQVQRVKPANDIKCAMNKSYLPDREHDKEKRTEYATQSQGPGQWKNTKSTSNVTDVKSKAYSMRFIRLISL
jgi:hypothetical protein